MRRGPAPTASAAVAAVTAVAAAAILRSILWLPSRGFRYKWSSTAGPASAIYRDYSVLDDAPVVERIVEQDDRPPVDTNGKKSCKTFAGGGYYWSPHGTVVTVTMTDDNGNKYTEKLRCEDGSWNTVNFALPTGGLYTYDAEIAYVDISAAP